MKKILLLNPPGEKPYLRDQYCCSVSKASYCWPPIDLIVLSGILSQEYEVRVIDAIVLNLSTDDCLQKILQEDFEAVIFLTGIASWEEDFRFIESIKKSSSVTTIGSGGILLYQAEEILKKHPYIDAVLYDFTTLCVLNYLKNKDSGGKIDNVIYQSKGQIIKGDWQRGSGQFEIPIPRHELFPLKRYQLPHGKRHPFTSVVTNHGCPFKCTFCIGGTLGFKYRPVENIMKELMVIARLGIKEVFFKDFTFGAHRKSAMELCRQMVKEKLDLTWICASRVNTVDEELLRLMKQAGCHTIQFGVESGNEGILQKYSKGITKDNIRAAFLLCKKNGIRTLAHFILGLPGEDIGCLHETIKFALELDCHYASFNLAIPQIGTKLREECLNNGWISPLDNPFDSSWGYPIIQTPELSRQDLYSAHKSAIKQFYLRPSYMAKMLFNIRSVHEFITLCTEGISLFVHSNPIYGVVGDKELHKCSHYKQEN